MKEIIKNINLKKVFLFIITYFVAFVIIGECYIFFLDGEVYNSDYIYDLVEFKDEEMVEEYVSELDMYSQEFDLCVYVAMLEIESPNEWKYIIYCFDKDMDYLKNKLQLNKTIENNILCKSLISGNIEFVFKTIDNIWEIKNEYCFNVYGDLEGVNQLRQLTIDKYGMTLPEESHYTNEAIIIVYTIFIFVSFIIIVYTVIQLNQIKREVLVRCLNGSNKKKIVLKIIFMNVVEIISSVIVASSLAGILTNRKFLLLTCIFVSIQILFISVLYTSFININVQKTLAKSYYSDSYIFFSFLSLIVLTIILTVALSYNVKNIIDSVNTINQEEYWQNFSDYSTIRFISRGEEEYANSKTDTEYAAKFYNEFINKYDICTIYDVDNCGQKISYGIDDPDGNSYVYVNLNGAKVLDELGIVDIDSLEKEKLYIISRHSDNYMRDKWEGNIKWIFSDNYIDNINTIQVEEDFLLLVYDINMYNLADNYKKKPIIILDTHTQVLGDLAKGLVHNSLIKISEDEFYQYIESIGYENEVCYISNVMDIYKQKKVQKVILLWINLVLSVMTLVMYGFTLSTVLKMDFNSRAVEIALDKVFGKTMLNRYKKIFRMLFSSYLIGVVLTILLKLVLYNFSVINIIISSIILMVFSSIIVYIFINKFEKINIQKILKGGI